MNDQLLLFAMLVDLLLNERVKAGSAPVASII